MFISGCRETRCGWHQYFHAASLLVVAAYAGVVPHVIATKMSKTNSTCTLSKEETPSHLPGPSVPSNMADSCLIPICHVRWLGQLWPRRATNGH
eukprot:4403375-Amphidinium_carterae.1